ncbi:MAG TPA: carboxypeptidase regulatory-like domain-containing protein [Micromonosporaceae bacterium]
MSTGSRRWRTAVVATVATLAMPLSTLATVPAAASPAAGDSTIKIEQKVRDQLAKKGTTSFWVVLDSQADLAGAARLKGKTDKARFVLTTKTRHAEKTQAGLRALLDRNHADYTSYWIHNSLLVTGDAGLLAKVAARPEVEAIEADDPVSVPDPLPGDTEPPVNGIEWNIDRVNAPQVWSGLGVRGEGIVVANIDTGVQHTHAAVANQYRGRNADGTFNHNYNWFDPAAVCPAGTPCDNNGHGTHTMGTMVGDDGAGNQIGVAPGAKWIAAKGCESSSCSRTSLLASGQWIVAPTDLAGQNPRPDLAPDVVNNSWGGSGLDTWYVQTVQSWIAAGIFPSFSNGNSGPGCSTSGNPGTYVISYSSGAFDINNAIASFSSRGPGENGDIKPNLASPGVNVRSSIPTGYASYSGTSMASPHTAATVALMWSASPAIQGDITATRQILDDTAIDVSNTTCGGTADDNNVFGEGRLDSYAAVLATPRGALGSLSGRVTASDGSALAGASVSVTGPMSRTTTTGADGSYSFDRLMVGDYTMSVTKFGYVRATGSATVTEGQTTVQDFTLQAAPSATLSGTVRLSSGDAAAGATLRVLGTPVSGTADSQGHYQLTLPYGDYQIEVNHTNRCASPTTEAVSLTGDTQRDFTLPLRTDGFGYACVAPTMDYTPGTERLPLVNEDQVAQISLPFRVPLYGKGYRNATVSTNGWMSFVSTTSSLPGNRTIPYTGTPNAVLYPFWDDFYLESFSGVYTGVTGTAPNRTFVVEWRDVSFYSSRSNRISFEALISENGEITFRYADIDSGVETGTSATVGIENATGTVAFQYSYNEAAVSNGGITFQTDKGVAQGLVTDANDGDPVAGATVTARAGGSVVDTAVSDSAGSYLLQLPAGGYQVTVEKEFYETATSGLTLVSRTVVSHTASLRTARVAVSTEALTVVVPANERRDRSITLTNTGGIGTQWDVAEANDSGTPTDVSWLSVSPAVGSLESGAASRVTVSLDGSAIAASSYQTARLLVHSVSGRNPTISIVVTIVAPGYQVALDSGGKGGVADSYGDTWSPDRAYTTGSAGHIGQSHTISTKSGISGTEDDSRFQTQREGMSEYRFDGLTDGVYTVELDFAELRTASPDQRYFDVHIEGTEALNRVDVAYEAGSFGAMNRTLTVHVTDGQLNVRFFAYRGFGTPIVNAIRVTERPDLTA